MTPPKKTPAPRQARKHPTLDTWLSSEIHQERLKQLLSDDVFIAACHYIAEKFRVTPDSICVESAELIARKTAMHTIASQFPDLLKDLIKKPVARTEFEPWAHINLDNK